jgi:hypothetical protein
MLNLDTGKRIEVGAGSHDPSTRVARFDIDPRLLTDGCYRAILQAGAASAIGASTADGDADHRPTTTSHVVEFVVLTGDANHDRLVDEADRTLLVSNWKARSATYSQGDFNYDGVVDLSDLGALATNWRKVANARVGGGASTASSRLQLATTNAQPSARFVKSRRHAPQRLIELIN